MRSWYSAIIQLGYVDTLITVWSLLAQTVHGYSALYNICSLILRPCIKIIASPSFAVYKGGKELLYYSTSTHHSMYFHMAMKYANTTYNFHLPSFAWCDEYMTLSTLVNSNSPSVVQHKNSAVFAVTDEKLLSIQLPRQPTKNCVVFIRDD